MKTTHGCFCAIAFALASTCGITPAASAEPPVRIMPLGDSLTSGLSSASVPGAYRNRLHQLLSNAGYTVDFVGTFTDTDNPQLPDVDHQGLGSARIDAIQSNIGGWLGAIESPDVVLLMIGTNDFWQNYQTSTAKDRLNSLIADISTRLPFAKIIVASLPLRTDSASIEAKQVEFNATIPGMVAEHIAMGRQVTHVDMHAALLPADLNGDGVHPTTTGFGKMADAWFPAIASVISPQGSADPPLIARTGPLTDLNHVSVVFSKPIEDAAATSANFSISEGLPVSAASLDNATKRIITLTTGNQTPGMVYEISVSGVRDRTGAHHVIAPQSMVAFSPSAITNGSFESDYPGWTASGNQEIKSSSPYVATDGNRIIAFNTGQSLPTGSITQTFTTSIGRTYELSFDFGVFGYSTSEQRLQVSVQGTSQLVSDTAALKGISGGNTRWVRKSYLFVADSTTTRLTLSDVSTTSLNLDLVLDNVRVGARMNRNLAITSTPAAGAQINISPNDLTGKSGGATGLIRSYTDAVTVNVTAPIQLGEIHFLKWQKNGVDLPNSGPALTLTMDGNHTLNAVYGSNHPPVAAADAYSTTGGTTLVVPPGGVLTNDSDPDGSALTAALNSPPLRGTLTLNPNGSFSYIPAPGFTGSDSFTYHAYDGVSSSSVVTVSLTVRPSTGQLLVNGSFESNFTGWTLVGNGSLQSAAPYTATDGTKLVSFNSGQTTPNGVLSQRVDTVSGQTYQLSFDAGAFGFNTNAQRIQVTATGSGTLLNQTISITCPGGGTTRWQPQAFSFIADGSSTTITFKDVSTTTSSLDLVLDNVKLAGASASHTLTVESLPNSFLTILASPPDATSASSGVTSFNRIYAEGTIVNLSAPAFAESTAFLKWRRNGSDYSINRHISVTMDAQTTMTAVYGSNTAPIAASDTYMASAGAPFTTPAPGVLINDTDAEGGNLIAIIESGPSHGSLVLNPNGGFTYTPDEGFTGQDSFSYHANDGSLNSNIATVNLTVSSVSLGALVNGSFEQGEAGWTAAGNRTVVDSGAPYIPTDGARLMVFNGNQTTPNATISQTFSTTPGHGYVLELDAGVIGGTGAQQLLRVTLQGTNTLFAQTLTINRGTTSPTWLPQSIPFVADSNSTTVTLVDKSTTTNSVDLLIDDIRITANSTRTLTVQSSPETAAQITVSPSDLNSQSDGSTPFNRIYPDGASVTLAAPATIANRQFIAWRKDGVDFSTNATTTLTLTANQTVTAVYSESTPSGEFVNGSFEAGETGWTASGNRLVVNSAAPYVATDGSRLMVFNGNQTIPNASISQTFATAIGQSYILEYDLGVIGGTGAQQRLQTTVAGNATLVSTLETVTRGTSSPTWTARSHPFIADSTSTTITLADASTTTNNVDLLIDNVRISAGTLRTLTVQSSAGAGVPVGVSPPDMNNLGDGTTVFTRLYEEGATVTLTSPPSFNGGAFLKWQINGNDAATSTMLEVTVNESLTATAVFVANAAPTANNDGYGTDMETTLTVAATEGTLINDVDPESETLTAELVSGPIHGSLTLDPDGAFTYTPTQGFVGTDSFTYRASDGFLQSATATVEITVSPFAPGTLVNGSFEDGANGWTITGNHVIASASAPYLPTDGTRLMVANGGNVTPNAIITQSFATTVGKNYVLKLDMGIVGGTTAEQRLRVTVTGTSQLFSQLETITGAGTSTAKWVPKTYTFTADNTTTTLRLADQSTTGTNMDLLIDNVRVALRVPRTLNVSSSPDAGITMEASPQDLNGSGTGTTNFTRSYDHGTTVTLTAPAVVGDAGFIRWTRNGVDHAGSATTTVLMDSDQTLVAIYGINHPPVAVADTWQVSMDQPISVPPPGVLANDTDPEATALNALLLDEPANGSLTLNADGGFTYTPNTDFTGTDTFTYTASDGALLSEPTTVTLVVRAPETEILLNGSFEEDYTSWSHSGNQGIQSQTPYVPSHGIKLVAFNGGQLAPNGVLWQTFPTVPGESYRLTFDAGVLAANTYSQIIKVTVNGSAPLLSQSITLKGVGGTIAKWYPQTFDFVADSVNTTLTFNDLSTTSSNIDLLLDNVSIKGRAVNRTMTISSSPAIGVEINVSPPDRSGSGNGVTNFTRSYPNGSVVVLTAPPSNEGLPFSKWRKNGQDLSGNQSVSVTVDAPLEMIAVYAPNAVPVAMDDTYATAKGYPFTIASPGVLANDTDAEGNPLTATLATLPSHGSVILDANGGFTYTPEPAYEGADSFTYTAEDDFGVSAVATVNLSIIAVVPGTLVNGSFEEDENGWVATGNRTVITAGSSYQAAHGSKLMVFNGGQTQPGGSISQEFYTVPGQAYVLDYGIGIVGATGTQQRLQVNLTGLNTLLSRQESISGAGTTSNWQPRSHTFIADGTRATLVFTDISTSTTNVDLLLDHIRLTPADSVNLTINSTRSTPVTITVTPADNSGNSSGQTPLTRVYDFGETVTLAAPSTAGIEVFQKWRKNGTDFSTNPSIVATLDGNHTFTAVYSAPAPPAQLLANGSFESGFTSWTVTGGTANPMVASNLPAADGVALAQFNSGNTTPSGSISQSFATTPGTSYALSFHIGVLAYNTNQQRIRTDVTGNGSLLSQTTSITGAGGGTVKWEPRTLNFTANSTSTTVTFTDVSTTTSSIDLLLDNITVWPSSTRFMLTVATLPASPVEIQVSPSDLDGNSNGENEFIRAYALNQVVTLTAPATSPAAGTFVKWRKNGVDYATTPTVTVTMDGYHNMTAIFTGPSIGLLTNGSFENGFNAWTTTGSTNSVKLNTTLPATHGVTLVEFNSSDTPPDGRVAQSFATVPGTTYSLAFDLGVRASNTNQQRLKVDLAGNGNLASQTMTINGIGGLTVKWEHKTLTFVANSTTTNLAMTDVSPGTASIDMLLDNVIVIAVDGVPVQPVLTVSSSGTTGLPVTITPNDANGGGNGNTTLSRVYPTGTSVTVTAPASSAGAVFIKWRKNGVDLTTNTSATVTMNGSHALTAVYTPAPLVFTNGSFESGLTGWSYTGTTDTVKVNSIIPATNGTTLIEFNSGNRPPDGRLSQTFDTTAGTTYSVTFDMGVLAYNTNPQRLTVSATGSSSLLSQTFTLNGIGSGNIKWITQTVTFTADSSSTTLTFADVSSSTSGIDLLLDWVRVAVVVPLPPNLLTNGSFEQDYSGWTRSGSISLESWGTAYATSGVKVLCYNSGGAAPGGSVSQSFATQSGTMYEITYDVGVRGANTKSQRMEMTVTGSGVLLTQTTTVTCVADYSVMTWAPQRFTFVANSANTTVTFKDVSTDGTNLDLFLDTVRVSVTQQTTGSGSGNSSANLLKGETPALESSPSSRTVSLEVAEAGLYVLEYSADLVNWHVHSEQRMNAPGHLEFEDADPAMPRMFYRIGKVRESGP